MEEAAAAAAAVAAATGGGGGVLHLLDRMGKQKHTKHTQSYKCVLHSLTVKPTANERKKKKTSHLLSEKHQAVQTHKL